MLKNFLRPSGAQRATSILFCALLVACGGGGNTADTPAASGASGSPASSTGNSATVVPEVSRTPTSGTSDSSSSGEIAIMAARDYIVAGDDSLRLEVSGLSANDEAQWSLRPGSPGTLDRSTGAFVLYIPPADNSIANDTSVVVTVTAGGRSASSSFTLLARSVAVAEPATPSPSPATPPAVAGLSLFAGNDSGSGWRDAVGTAARFSGPRGMVRDLQGNTYVADQWHSTIRRIAPDGTVTTLAGLVTPQTMKGVDGTGAAARFVRPYGMTIDAAGNLYVTDDFDHTIRKVTPTGVVTTVAGAAGEAGYADGIGGAARFNRPLGITADSAGNLYVSDYGNMMIRKITPAGVVTTFARNDMTAPMTARMLSGPNGIGIDAAGNLYVVDFWQEQQYPVHTSAAVRKITPQGVVTTLAGTEGMVALAGGTFPNARDGTGTGASFHWPSALAMDTAGNIFVTERFSGQIRMITPNGVVTTIASIGDNGPLGIVLNPDGSMLVSGVYADAVYRVATNRDVIIFAGAPANEGSLDGTAASALFHEPTSVAGDAAGNRYVADSKNHTIRKISALGEVSTLAGTAGESGTADGIGAAARFDSPTDIAVDTAGNVYVAHNGPYPQGLIRKITPAGVVTTLATDALNSPVSVDAAGNVYAVDGSQESVWKITPSGVRSTISPRTLSEASTVLRIKDMIVDPAGNIFVIVNNGIRKIGPNGVTLIGPQGNVTDSSTWAYHQSLAIDQEGNLYTAYGSPDDPYGRVIRRTTQTGVVSDVFNLRDIGVPTRQFSVVGPNTFALPAGGGILLLRLP